MPGQDVEGRGPDPEGSLAAKLKSDSKPVVGTFLERSSGRRVSLGERTHGRQGFGCPPTSARLGVWLKKGSGAGGVVGVPLGSSIVGSSYLAGNFIEMMLEAKYE